MKMKLQKLFLLSLLQGKVAGLSMSVSSSTPGAANSITIRGANSIAREIISVVRY